MTDSFSKTHHTISTASFEPRHDIDQRHKALQSKLDGYSKFRAKVWVTDLVALEGDFNSVTLTSRPNELVMPRGKWCQGPRDCQGVSYNKLVDQQMRNVS